MLSILIPVYNFQITDLVQELHNQIKENNIQSEIIIVDDNSTLYSDVNKTVDQLDSVTYERLPKNIGRAAIRNYLAKKANYEYLLFIDCDAKVINDYYLTNYIHAIDSETDVICGGICYENSVPDNREFILRWYYGIKREYRRIEERNKNPYKSFSSFHFLIRKQIFDQVKFDTRLSNYGHEDTLLGIQLEKTKVNLKHIDNPLLHNGLDNSETFLRKTELSVENLKYLLVNNVENLHLKNKIKLVKCILFVKKIRMTWLLKILFKVFKKQILTNLKSLKPSLILFDFYKIGYYFNL